MNLNYIVKDRKQLVIAEIAQSHDGSLNMFILLLMRLLGLAQI